MTTIFPDTNRHGIEAGEQNLVEPEASGVPGMHEADALGKEWEMPAIGDYESFDVPPVQ